MCSFMDAFLYNQSHWLKNLNFTQRCFYECNFPFQSSSRIHFHCKEKSSVNILQNICFCVLQKKPLSVRNGVMFGWHYACINIC